MPSYQDTTEDFECTTKRHPARTYYKTGVKLDGSLVAAHIEFDLDCSAYVTLSPVVLSRGIIHASGPYFYPAIDIRGTAYATHTPPNGAFRGFGAPQVYFGIERHMDKIARAIGMDPVQLRLKNALRPGMMTATGQRLQESVSAVEVLEDALKRSNARATLQSDEQVARGRGVALYMHGTGFTGSGESRMKSVVRMCLHRNGDFEILTSSTDIGQGTLTVFPQIAATVLGVDYDRVFVGPSDTDLVPDSGPTVASRTVTIVGRVVENLARQMLESIQQFASERWGGNPSEYGLEGGWLTHRRPDSGVASLSGAFRHAQQEPSAHQVARLQDVARFMCGDGAVVTLEACYQLPPGHKWDEATYSGDAYPAFSWGCTIVSVAVDRDALEVTLAGVTAVHDVGTLIHPVLAEGQIEGGVAQALGYGMMEEVKWHDGKILNPNFTNYIMPTSLDLPDLDVGFVENPYSYGPFGAKGIGEIPMNGAGPALANAVSLALGVELDVLPVTPERILEALRLKGEGGGPA